MKCSVHASVETETVCSKCDTPLCDDCNVAATDKAAICTRCVALGAISDFDDQELLQEQQLAAHREAKEKQLSTTRKLQIGVVVLALFLVPLQIILLSGSETPIPIVNINDSEEVTEECIRNLLVISDLLQEDLLPPDDLRCPASPVPYRVIYDGDNVIVEDPHPELHGYSRMSVSKYNPFPVIIE
jgi:hypothetical protein